MEDKGARNVILFNSTKKELFTPSNGFKTLNRKLRSTWKINTSVSTSLSKYTSSTLSQTTSFRLFQTERVCRRQLHTL